VIKLGAETEIETRTGLGELRLERTIQLMRIFAGEIRAPKDRSKKVTTSQFDAYTSSTFLTV
jgi:hypothetical protein